MFSLSCRLAVGGYAFRLTSFFEYDNSSIVMGETLVQGDGRTGKQKPVRGKQNL